MVRVSSYARAGAGILYSLKAGSEPENGAQKYFFKMGASSRFVRCGQSFLSVRIALRPSSNPRLYRSKKTAALPMNGSKYRLNDEG